MYFLVESSMFLLFVEEQQYRVWYGKSILHLLMRFETRKLENEEMIISYAEQQLQFYYYNALVYIGEEQYIQHVFCSIMLHLLPKSPLVSGGEKEHSECTREIMHWISEPRMKLIYYPFHLHIVSSTNNKIIWLDRNLKLKDIPIQFNENF